MSDIAVQASQVSKVFNIGRKKSGSLIETIKQSLNYKKNKLETEFWALSDVSFEIKKGEAIGIVGKNGAGKSTLLKILSRITDPTTGRLELNGRVSSLLEVGTGFHPELSGRENIFLNGTILGMKRSEIRNKFDEIVDFSGVEKFLDTPVKKYSSGMYVRLAFAVAAHLEPEILIVDEVLAVGDAEFQNKCLGKMNEVSKQGRTVIFVSHNLNSIKSLCTRGILLKAGKVTLQSDIDTLIATYAQIEDNFEDGRNRNFVKINSIDFVYNGEVVDSIPSGADLEINIDLTYQNIEIGNLKVGICIENLFGTYVMRNYSHFQGVVFKSDSGKYKVKIKNVPFVPATYKVHLIILNDEQEIYWNPTVKMLNVHFGDVYGTGMRGEEDLCAWILKIDWAEIK